VAKKDAYNALRDFNEPKIQATPRNALMGYLADAIAGVDNYAQQADNTMPMGKANPVLSILSNAFGIPGTARTLDRLSYGEPVTNYGKANVPLIPDDTTDALMMGAGAVSGAARMAPQAARIARIAADNARAPSTVPRLGERGAVVYHGSPHKFDAFDASKIGTGEGAQAYGHGLYFAESPDVAQVYKEALAKTPVTSYMAGGSEIVPGSARWHAADIADRMKTYSIDPKTKDGRDWLASELGARYMGGSDVSKADVMKYLKIGVEKKKELGALYSVDLPDEKIARMLDWDKPLLEQSPEVKAALGIPTRDFAAEEAVIAKAKRLGVPASSLPEWKQLEDQLDKLAQFRSKTGQTFYNGGTAQDRAEELRRMGIPGIRYLDGGSRTGGAGTSNFVVFPGEENALRILERNGQKLR
jgi:hypothetical protein